MRIHGQRYLGVDHRSARRPVKKRSEIRELRERYNLLTPREREVMTLVVAGLLDKQVAGKLSTTEATIKFHRAHIMNYAATAMEARLCQGATVVVAGGGNSAGHAAVSFRRVPRKCF